MVLFGVVCWFLGFFGGGAPFFSPLFFSIILWNDTIRNIFSLLPSAFPKTEFILPLSVELVCCMLLVVRYPLLYSITTQEPKPSPPETHSTRPQPPGRGCRGAEPNSHLQCTAPDGQEEGIPRPLFPHNTPHTDRAEVRRAATARTRGHSAGSTPGHGSGTPTLGGTRTPAPREPPPAGARPRAGGGAAGALTPPALRRSRLPASRGARGRRRAAPPALLGARAPSRPPS